MRCPAGVTTFLSTSVVAYALAAVVLGVAVDRKAATFERLNAVQEWGDYPARLESGQAGYDERRLRFAVRYYKLAAKIVPRSDQPYATIGYCYARLGEDARAVQYFQKALELNRRHFWLEYNLGVLYSRMNDPRRAAGMFQGIAGRELQELAPSAILSPLSRMPVESRRMLFAKAGAFALDLQQKSRRWSALIGAERTGGRSPEISREVVLHPWAGLIQPGKEIYY